MLKETVKGMMIAGMVASMFAGVAAHAKEGDAAGGKTVKCLGVNSCKGKSACATKESSCAGANTCKGKGWIKLSEKECKAKGGKVVE